MDQKKNKYSKSIGLAFGGTMEVGGGFQGVFEYKIGLFSAYGAKK